MRSCNHHGCNQPVAYAYKWVTKPSPMIFCYDHSNNKKYASRTEEEAWGEIICHALVANAIVQAAT